MAPRAFPRISSARASERPERVSSIPVDRASGARGATQQPGSGKGIPLPVGRLIVQVDRMAWPLGCGSAQPPAKLGRARGARSSVAEIAATGKLRGRAGDALRAAPKKKADEGDSSAIASAFVKFVEDHNQATPAERDPACQTPEKQPVGDHFDPVVAKQQLPQPHL